MKCCKCSIVAGSYRFENCEALRAFLRPGLSGLDFTVFEIIVTTVFIDILF